MKIKRFVAPDMRQAIREVREEQGPDAVILSSRSIDGGTEIIAAVDFDQQLVSEIMRTAVPTESSGREAPPAEPRGSSTKSRARPEPTSVQAAQGRSHERSSAGAFAWSQDPALLEMRRELKGMRHLLREQLSQLAWADFSRRQPLRAQVLERLVRLGLSGGLARELVDRLERLDHLDHAWREALYTLAQRVPVTDDAVLSTGGIVALVGPTGVGKTTTVAKLAARFALRHGRQQVALVTTDCYRVGSQRQLETFARILGAPMYVAETRKELGETLHRLADTGLVLVDTAGMSQRSEELGEHFAGLADTPLVRTYLVLAANAQRAVLEQTARAFARAGLSGCILTKLDEATSLGEALSVALNNSLPVAYVSDGQRVPEDLMPARAHSLVTRAVALARRFDEDRERETEILPAFAPPETESLAYA